MTKTKVETKQKPKYNFPDEFKKHFRNLDFRFEKYPSSKIEVFSSIEQFTEYIQRELEFWNEIGGVKLNEREFYNVTVEKVINEFENIMTLLKECQNIISGNSYYKDTLKKLDNKLKSFEEPSFPLVFSESEFAIKVKLMKDKGNSYAMIAGFFKGCFPEVSINSLSRNLVDTKFYIGYNFGVRFTYPEYFTEVDTNFLKEADSVIEKLNGEYNNFLNRTEDRSRSIEDRFYTLESENESNVIENNSMLLDLKTKKETELENLLADKKDELERLEETYKEKLKLSEPANYWKKASDSYARKGWIWAGASAVVGLAIIIILYFILKNTSVSDVWNLESIKFTVVLTVIISIGFLLVNLSIKLALSNFHLSTDATERYKLTYLYLALLNEKDNAVSEKERSIVFQALFSRSDSGLTKSDSGVQLPNANQLFELNNK